MSNTANLLGHSTRHYPEFAQQAGGVKPLALPCNMLAVRPRRRSKTPDADWIRLIFKVIYNAFFIGAVFYFEMGTWRFDSTKVVNAFKVENNI